MLERWKKMIKGAVLRARLNIKWGVTGPTEPAERKNIKRKTPEVIDVD